MQGNKLSPKNRRQGPMDSNLTWAEMKGVKSLKRRVKEGDLLIAQTDKSARFAVMLVKQYLETGAVHTHKDKEMDWAKVKYLKNQVNSHVWWLSKILGYGKNTDQPRMLKNIQDHGQEVPEMVLLVKDHKSWKKDAPIPMRPVVSGNKCINTYLPELLSETGTSSWRSWWVRNLIY